MMYKKAYQNPLVGNGNTKYNLKIIQCLKRGILHGQVMLVPEDINNLKISLQGMRQFPRIYWWSWDGIAVNTVNYNAWMHGTLKK